MNTEPAVRKQLQTLRRDPQAVWQIGLGTIPMCFDGITVNPTVACCVDRTHQTAGIPKDVDGDPDDHAAGFQAARVAFLGFALGDDSTEAQGFLPSRVEFDRVDLVQSFESFLDGLAVEVALVPTLDGWNQAMGQFVQIAEERTDALLSTPLSGGLIKPDPTPPLTARKAVKHADIVELAEAARAFFTAAPWQHFDGHDLIYFDAPKPPVGLTSAVVMGSGGEEFGLVFFDGPEDLRYLIRANKEGVTSAGMEAAMDRWAVHFEPADSLPPADLAYWKKHRLPASAPGIYPIPVWYGRLGDTKRPGAEQLRYLSAVLRALAGTDPPGDATSWSVPVPRQGKTSRFRMSRVRVEDASDSAHGANADDTRHVLDLRLNDITPSIWRRVSVPSWMTLGNLHDVLQILFDWNDGHLHEFAPPRRGPRRSCDAIYGPMDDDENFIGLGHALRDEDAYTLSEILAVAKERLVYTYDFGDNWEVMISVVSIDPDDHAEEADHPMLLDGQRAGPPDDCGGPGGYAMMLEALGDPDHSEHAGFAEWLGEGFDPELFDLRSLNRQLRRFFR